MNPAIPLPHRWFAAVYERMILKRPRLTLILLVTAVCLLGAAARNFKLDASAESLMLENDRSLRLARTVSERYGSEDILAIAFRPKSDLFSDSSLSTMARLRDDLKRLPRVASVLTILDVPLLENRNPADKQTTPDSGLLTLQSPSADRERARLEFKESPLYRNLLVSPDLKYAALRISFAPDVPYGDLMARRLRLQDKQTAGGLSPAEKAEYEQVDAELRDRRALMRERRHGDIAAIRSVMKTFAGEADLFLGGVEMIADDMISFIESDLRAFGSGVCLLMVVILYLVFRRIRWIVLPLLCCAFSVLSMMGFLGLFGWEVTVISSNFIALQLIITMAIVIHLIVRYRELLRAIPNASQYHLLLETVVSKIRPCLYAALTTIAGFGSLLLCDILPVINFGWMMCAGIGVSLVLTFILFPAGAVLLDRESVPAPSQARRFSLTALLAGCTERYGVPILVAAAVLLALSVAGIFRLTVENSFIDYFKKDTEIYRGMAMMDRHLGGTTPLDVLIRFEEAPTAPAPKTGGTDGGADSVFEEFDELDGAEADETYWFTPQKMARVAAVHDYLDGLPEIGKVLSLGTVMKLAERQNDGRPLDGIELALLFKNMPEPFKTLVVQPYVSIARNEVRFSVRIMDSLKSLRRDALLRKIQSDLVARLGFNPEDVQLSGVMVMYNNMLQSLFTSQILTFGVVLLALLAMFLLLFRRLDLGLIALFPNLTASMAVLGLMGWMDIPLDMMTITIAAISIGIAVDNTIHYICRFKEEIAVDHDYIGAMHRSHGSIGRALTYTSLIIIIGFSILVLSNFIPTIYFGLFTGLAMLIALVASLTLLPRLLILFKPFGRV